MSLYSGSFLEQLDFIFYLNFGEHLGVTAFYRDIWYMVTRPMVIEKVCIFRNNKRLSQKLWKDESVWWGSYRRCRMRGLLRRRAASCPTRASSSFEDSLRPSPVDNTDNSSRNNSFLHSNKIIQYAAWKIKQNSSICPKFGYTFAKCGICCILVAYFSFFIHIYML